MNGAEAVLATLAGSGVEACFANPGTSEMQLVAAFDREPRVRPVLCLFEGVATGAADGYGRVAGRPAATLLHLGPGLANGGANLHNARRAGSPVVNLVGDHARHHLVNDAPLSSDIDALAGALGVWTRRAVSADDAALGAAEAVAASRGLRPGPATLVLPADTCWTEAAGPAAAVARWAPPAAPGSRVEALAAAVRGSQRPVVLLGSPALSEAGLHAAARLAGAGVRVLFDTFVSRLPRGAGRFAPDRMLYFGEQATADLQGVDLLLLCGTRAPVAFFAYPGAPTLLTPEGARALTLAAPEEDAAGALELLADALGAADPAPAAASNRPDAPFGAITPHALGASLARHMPEGAIVSDDAVTAGLPVFQGTAGARPHDWLMLTGGAIGQGLPVAVGAAVARPGAKVVCVTGDGAGAYTLQALWTLAREGLDVVTVVVANGRYRILDIELARTGAGKAGAAARSLLDLRGPALDWCALAQGFGVPAERLEEAGALDAAIARAMAEPGPRLLEAVVG